MDQTSELRKLTGIFTVIHFSMKKEFTTFKSLLEKQYLHKLRICIYSQYCDPFDGLQLAISIAYFTLVNRRVITFGHILKILNV